MPLRFLAELKRRNVIRMAGLYLVGAWLIVQVASTVFPAFDLPGWALRGVILLLGIGFVPTLVFSWLYELTPEGLKRDAEVTLEQSIAAQTGRRMDRLIFAGLIALIAVIAADRWWPRTPAPLPSAPVAPEPAAAPASASDPAAVPAESAAIDPKSIAVLPFVNMSGDPDNEYFSDGVSEEILNVLAGSPELRVAARTSSFSFKVKSLEVPEIARALNVRMVLEGSVRRQGDSVRVTAQLIDAQSGFHLWSQTFDRKLVDIFAIQDEIARAIGDALKVTLGGNEGTVHAAAGTGNLEAYDLYLRGMGLWQQRREEPLWQAIALFEQATAADPQFAQGYAGLAMTYAVIGSYSNRLAYADTLARARDYAEQALALDPGNPEPYAALALVAANELRRSTASALYLRSIALRPSFASAHQWQGTALMSSGDLAGGLAALERASKLDPRSLVVAQNHAYALRALGRDDDARARCMTALQLDPSFGACWEDVGLAALQVGDFEAARSALQKQAALDNPSGADQARELVEALAGSGDRRALALRMAAHAWNSKFEPGSGNALEGANIPAVLMLLGEHELALEYVERLAGEPGGIADWAIMLPALDPIRCLQRFKAVVAQLKTSDPHAARGCVATE